MLQLTNSWQSDTLKVNYQYKHKLNYYNGVKTFGSPL